MDSSCSNNSDESSSELGSVWLKAFFTNKLSIEDYLILRGQYKRCKEEKEKETFSLTDLTDTYCVEFFRFTKSELRELRQRLRIPDTIKLKNGTLFSGIEGLCVVLCSLSRPNNIADHVKIFSRKKSVIRDIFEYMIGIIHLKWNHLLNTLLHPWLTQKQLCYYSELINAAGCSIPNIAGFIDTKYFQSKENTRLRSKIHKFHIISLPNGLVIKLDGAFIGSTPNSSLTTVSKLQLQMRQHWKLPDGRQLRLFGDNGNVNTSLICSSHRGKLSQAQEIFNLRMYEHSVHSEYGFGRVLKFFPFVDFKNGDKLILQPVNNMYRVATILMNCHTCLKGANQTSLMYNCSPVSLSEYLWE